MSVESEGVDPYAIVLADLRAKRDQIDQAIQAIESVRGGAAAATSSAAKPGVSQTVAAEGPGDYLGLTIAEAAKKMLAARRKALSNAELVAGFKAGGLAMNSADEMNTVNAVLARRFQNVGDIVRVSRGVWGLKEWYPNRSFKKDVAKDEDQPAKSIEQILDEAERSRFDPSGPVQPSRPKPSAAEE